MSEYQNGAGLQRVLRAFAYSWQGLRTCYRHEAAFRQELWGGLVVIPLGLWLGDNGIERAMLAGSWILVLIVELLNSAVEAAIDRFGSEHHELSGRAKDAGSAAVLLAISLAILVWLLVLWPRF
jgi:diacylglycerol kinase (ATP)